MIYIIISLILQAYFKKNIYIIKQFEVVQLIGLLFFFDIQWQNQILRIFNYIFSQFNLQTILGSNLLVLFVKAFQNVQPEQSKDQTLYIIAKNERYPLNEGLGINLKLNYRSESFFINIFDSIIPVTLFFIILAIIGLLKKKYITMKEIYNGVQIMLYVLFINFVVYISVVISILDQSILKFTELFLCLILILTAITFLFKDYQYKAIFQKSSVLKTDQQLVSLCYQIINTIQKIFFPIVIIIFNHQVLIILAQVIFGILKIVFQFLSFKTDRKIIYILQEIFNQTILLFFTIAIGYQQDFYILLWIFIVFNFIFLTLFDIQLFKEFYNKNQIDKIQSSVVYSKPILSHLKYFKEQENIGDWKKGSNLNKSGNNLMPKEQQKDDSIQNIQEYEYQEYKSNTKFNYPDSKSISNNLVVQKGQIQNSYLYQEKNALNSNQVINFDNEQTYQKSSNNSQTHKLNNNLRCPLSSNNAQSYQNIYDIESQVKQKMQYVQQKNPDNFVEDLDVEQENIEQEEYLANIQQAAEKSKKSFRSNNINNIRSNIQSNIQQQSQQVFQEQTIDQEQNINCNIVNNKQSDEKFYQSQQNINNNINSKQSELEEKSEEKSDICNIQCNIQQKQEFKIDTSESQVPQKSHLCEFHKQKRETQISEIQQQQEIQFEGVEKCQDNIPSNIYKPNNQLVENKQDNIQSNIYKSNNQSVENKQDNIQSNIQSNIYKSNNQQSIENKQEHQEDKTEKEKQSIQVSSIEIQQDNLPIQTIVQPIQQSNIQPTIQSTVHKKQNKQDKENNIKETQVQSFKADQVYQEFLQKNGITKPHPHQKILGQLQTSKNKLDNFKNVLGPKQDNRILENYKEEKVTVTDVITEKENNIQYPNPIQPREIPLPHKIKSSPTKKKTLSNVDPKKSVNGQYQL